MTMKKNDIIKVIREGFQEGIFEEGDRNSKRYMFISNLEQMCRQANKLMEEEPEVIDSILDDGHDWAADHVSTAKESLDQVFDFMMNKINGDDEYSEEDEVSNDLDGAEDVEESMSRSQTNFRGKNKKPANYPWVKGDRK